jgi:hypothetical protein
MRANCPRSAGTHTRATHPGRRKRRKVTRKLALAHGLIEHERIGCGCVRPSFAGGGVDAPVLAATGANGLGFARCQTRCCCAARKALSAI